MMNYLKSSGEITASTNLQNGVAMFGGVQVITNGTDDATIIVYDSLTAAGVKLYEGTVLGANLTKFDVFNHPVKASTGLYISVAGTGASVIVYYA